jgi:hypothetical protein
VKQIINLKHKKMPLIIYGNVKANGTKTAGNNFTVVPYPQEGAGFYKISFDKAFTEVPTIVGSQINFLQHFQDTRDGVVFTVVKKDHVIAKTGDSFGKGTDRNFSFIAMGPYD